MALADFAAFKALLARRGDVVNFHQLAVNHTDTGFNSTWTGFGGSAPSTAAACTRATPGAILPIYASASAWYAVEISAYRIGSTTPAMPMILADRLSHQGGLSGTATSEQTTNLPTAALTRYTSGVGVMAAVEIYSNIGATPQTVTINYTDQDGNAGQTSYAQDIGGGSNDGARRMITMPLADGDTGVRSVQGVTLSGSTGTAGDFGVTLYKPLIMFNAMSGREVRWSPFDSGWSMPEINDDACLYWVDFWGYTGQNVTVNSMLALSQVA